MQSLLQKITTSLKNPLVLASLLLGIAGAPPMYYSGIFIGQGKEVLGGLCFIAYVVIYTVDALITLTLIINRD